MCLKYITFIILLIDQHKVDFPKKKKKKKTCVEHTFLWHQFPKNSKSLNFIIMNFSLFDND